MRYEIVWLDIWGNDADGYWVNDVQRSNIRIDLPEQFTDEEFEKVLSDHIYFPRKPEIEWSEDILFISDSETGKPLIQLWRV